MSSIELKIKNMVCPRCIKVVKQELESLGYKTLVERLGSARIEYTGDKPDLNAISKTLEKNGFELLIEKNAILIEEIKTIIIDLIYKGSLEEMSINLSSHLSTMLSHDYSHISTLFSSVEGITIEKYFILQKIERVKELLIYDELSLTQISYELGYSNVQYLSSQFKKVTGMSTSEFKSLRGRNRVTLDKIGIE